MKASTKPARIFWMLAHRYLGLFLAGFLLVTGLTGCLLAFYPELDAVINADMMHIDLPDSDARPLDPILLRDIVQSRNPDAWVHTVELIVHPGQAMMFKLTAPLDPRSGEQRPLRNDQIFIDPYTGDTIGSRKWGDITQGVTNVMPFVYRVHHTLGLGEPGEYILGIVALLWTLDCFIGAYLTFPARLRTSSVTNRAFDASTQIAPLRRWFLRWWPAWKIRWNGGKYKINFDLHRAGGLWPWILLLILAWSAVGFNLQEVYKPVTEAFFARQTGLSNVPKPAAIQAHPGIPWNRALGIGKSLMDHQAKQDGFTVLQDYSLSYDPHRGLYRYRVQSDLDISGRVGSTSVWFDANTGGLKAVFYPTGTAPGDTITTWLISLHMAAVWGLPHQIAASIMGLTVSLLSFTGVIIWWKKYAARRAHGNRKNTSRTYPSLTAWDT